MPRKYLAFDIETVKPFPDGDDWKPHRPLGIGCAAGHASNMDLTWFSREDDGTIAERMKPQDLTAMVEQLTHLSQNGYTIATWNGLGFDFDVLAEESGMEKECIELALGHVDMMFHIYMAKGHPLGLDTAAKGMEIEGKTEGMDGKKATEMWAQGDRQPVIDYCAQDVRATLAVAETCERLGRLEWTSRAGRHQRLNLRGGWIDVQNAVKLPDPDNSWMTEPLLRGQFTDWLKQDSSQGQDKDQSDDQSDDHQQDFDGPERRPEQRPVPDPRL